MDEASLKNYTKRTETISVPYLTAQGQALGYTIRGGQLRAPPTPPGAERKPLPPGVILAYRKVRRTWWRDVNSGHTHHEDEPVADQVADGSYRTNPTSQSSRVADAVPGAPLGFTGPEEERAAWDEHLARMGATGAENHPDYPKGANGPAGPFPVSNEGN